jgi:hypothetical protein
MKHLTYTHIITGFILGTTTQFNTFLVKLFTIPYIIGNFAGLPITALAIIVFTTVLINRKRNEKKEQESIR